MPKFTKLDDQRSLQNFSQDSPKFNYLNTTEVASSQDLSKTFNSQHTGAKSNSTCEDLTPLKKLPEAISHKAEDFSKAVQENKPSLQRLLKNIEERKQLRLSDNFQKYGSQESAGAQFEDLKMVVVVEKNDA